MFYVLDFGSFTAERFFCMFQRVSCVGFVFQKPLSTDEALDSLSAGFLTSTSPAKPEVRLLTNVAVRR